MAFKPRSRVALEIVAIIVLSALILWPFFWDPASILYIRYFDAETYFDPIGKLVRSFQPWDVSQHLGFDASRAMMYFSIQSLAYAAFAALGPNVLVRATAVVTITLVFAAAFAYLKILDSALPRLPRAIAALFFATNPYVVGLIHDGYFSLLTQYALLPISLATAEWGRRRCRYEALVAILAAFVATSLYNLPLVAIDLCTLAAIYWRFVLAALKNGRTLVGVGCVLATQSFWIIPVVIGIAFPNVAYQDTETNGDIAISSQYGTLTNALLLRSNPEFWSSAYLGARECTGCEFYESSAFLLAMSALVLVAAFALYRLKRWGLLAVLASAVVLATGTHYAGEFLGTPYAILTGVPLVRSMFRGAVKFGSVAALVYTVGIAYAIFAFERSRRPVVYTGAIAFAILAVAWPLISGNVIERGPIQRDSHLITQYSGMPWPYAPRVVIGFPNFPVRLPPAYMRLVGHTKAIDPSEPILIEPNQAFAAYSWGAYGNEFVSAIARHETLQVNYAGEPNPFVGPMLFDLGDPNIDPDSARGYLRALRIGEVLFRKDALFATAVSLKKYGHIRWTDGDLVGIGPVDRANPLVQRASRPVQVLGSVEKLERFSLFTGAIVRTNDKELCTSKDPIGLADPVGTGKMSSLIPTTCTRDVRVDIAVDGPRVSAAISPAINGSCSRTVTTAKLLTARRNGVTYAALFGRTGAFGTCLNLDFSREHFRYALISDRAGHPFDGAVARAESAPEIWPGIRRISAARLDSVVSLNESNDPTFVGFQFAGNRFMQIAKKFVPYGYANGFYVPADSTIYIVQILDLGLQFGGLISLAALVACFRLVLLARTAS